MHVPCFNRMAALLLALNCSVASAALAAPQTNSSPGNQPKPPADGSSWIVGLGGGARIGLGEPTYGMVYGRLGRLLNQSLSLSLRPAYVFGNSDAKGKANAEGAFQLPITLDIQPRHWLSPYLGAGIATNTDSSGSVDPMLSAGLDLRLAKNVNAVVGLNYVIQANDNNKRDVEALSVVYLRF